MEQDNNFIKNKPLIFQTNEEITLPPEQWQQQEEKDADGNFVFKCIVDGDLKDAVLTALPMQNDKHKPDFLEVKIIFSGKLNGDKFIGAVLSGAINKDRIGKMYGFYKYKSGASYEGLIQNGEPSGSGKYIYPNGCVLEGEFKNIIDPNRFVSIVSIDGSLWSGFLAAEHKHGAGSLTTKDKIGNMIKFEGIYENNFIKQVSSITFTKFDNKVGQKQKETKLIYPTDNLNPDSINFEQKLFNRHGAEINNLTKKGTIAFADNNRMELLKYFGDTTCEGFAEDFKIQYFTFITLQELNNKLAEIKQTLEQNKTENFEAIFRIPEHALFVESERSKNGEIIFNAFDINQEKGQDVLFESFKEKNTDINKYPEIQKLNYVNDFKFSQAIKLSAKTQEGKDFMLEFYAPQVCRHLTAILPTVHEKNKENTKAYLERTSTIRAMSPSRKSL